MIPPIIRVQTMISTSPDHDISSSFLLATQGLRTNSSVDNPSYAPIVRTIKGSMRFISEQNLRQVDLYVIFFINWRVVTGFTDVPTFFNGSVIACFTDVPTFFLMEALSPVSLMSLPFLMEALSPISLTSQPFLMVALSPVSLISRPFSEDDIE